MQESLAERFERLVDRTGEHHLWTGAVKAGRGTGRLKVDGRQVTAHRVAWELKMLKRVLEAPGGGGQSRRRETGGRPVPVHLDDRRVGADAPDYMTKQVAKLKSHLGIEDKKPETATLGEPAAGIEMTGTEPTDMPWP